MSSSGASMPSPSSVVLAVVLVSFTACAFLWRRNNMTLAKLKSVLIQKLMQRAIGKLTKEGELQIDTRLTPDGSPVRFCFV